jgi:hypothetical protein
MSQIYLQTGKWPRLVADDLHFRIPLWKHMIEQFGAVPASSDILVNLAKLGHPVLVYPTEHRLLEVQSLNSATIIPFASVGVNEMVKVLTKVPYNPPDGTQKLTIAVPVSYERQYISFGAACTLDESADNVNGLVEQCVATRAAHGDKRYLLQFIGKSLKFVGDKLFRKGGMIHTGALYFVDFGKKGTLFVLKSVTAQLEEMPATKEE